MTKLALLDATGLDLPGTWMWESLKIPVIGELAVKLSTGKSAVRGLAEGMMVNKQRVTDQLLDEWWAPMTFHDNIRATYLLERRLDWLPTERALSTTETLVLVLWGRQDTVQPVERAHHFAELLPDARLQILDGCGHAPSWTARNRSTSTSRPSSPTHRDHPHHLPVVLQGRCCPAWHLRVQANDPVSRAGPPAREIATGRGFRCQK
ncbi:hypothetical protein [Nonomuraea dietziae]|uniref:alpha/beta fold hydrolase n=1 Tax=Nonomuraea dietziae TaxID=65515 RepID=UPI0031DE00A3